MTKQEEIVNTIRVLRGELEILSSRLKPHGTGYIYTALDVIQSRVDELVEEVTAPYWKDEDGDIGRLPGQTRSSHLRSVEGAYDENVYGNLEGQARLRRIQDSAAGRKPNAVRDAYLWSANKEGHWSPNDDVEHTKEYYDTERNKSQSMTSPHKNVYDNASDIQNMSSDGLSNHSMKQKYGHAVQTTSEMMEEELEPLPINTFE